MTQASGRTPGKLAQIQQIVAEIRSDSWVDSLLRGNVTKLLPNIGEGATPTALSQLGSLDPRIAQMVRPLSQPIDALSHDNRQLTSVVAGPLRTIGHFTSSLEHDLDADQRKLATLWKDGAAATAVQHHMTDLRMQLNAGSLATAGLAAAVDRGGLVVAAAKQVAVAVAQAAGVAALTWIRTQALGLLAQGVNGINQIIQHIAGDLQRAARRIADVAIAGVRSLGHLKNLIARLKQAIVGGGSPGGPPKPPASALAQRAREMLAKLPNTELAGRNPLPVLGAPGGPAVQRDGTGLIKAVLVDGKWLDQRSYVDQLMQQRVAQLKEAIADPTSDISKGKSKPCVSVAVDWRTGQVAEGHNNLRIVPDDLHPLLKGRLDDYKAESERVNAQHEWPTPYLHPSVPGAHAEIYAVNRLLWEREAAGVPVNAATPGELRIDNYFPWLSGGKSAPCCANCSAILTGIPCNAGKLLDFGRENLRRLAE